MSYPPSSPLHLLQTLPGYFTETEPFLSETVPPEIMLPVPGSLQIELLQKEIGNILRKGGFSIKSWEHSGEDRASKYLGMTWNSKNDCYFLKFSLNLFKKFHGIPSGADLDEEFLQDQSIPITK